MRSLTRDQVRAVDLRAIGEYSLPGIVLMENAGRNAAHLLMALASLDPVDPPLRVAIACGRGNNGGDGFVIARHLENLGAEIKLLLACDPAAYRGDAARERTASSQRPSDSHSSMLLVVPSEIWIRIWG